MKYDRHTLIIAGLASFIALVSAFVVAINICSGDYREVGTWAAGGALSTTAALILLNLKNECKRMLEPRAGSGVADNVPSDSPYRVSQAALDHRETYDHRHR